MTDNLFRLPLKVAAAAFGVGYQRLYDAVRADELPALQVGTRWLVRPDDVEEYLQSIGAPNGAERARAV